MSKNIVKKKREVAEKKGSDDDEDWTGWEFAGENTLIDGETSGNQSPSGNKSPSNAKRYKKYWSQFLGCFVQSERKKRKPKLLILGELFGMFLKADDIDKEERLKMIKVIVLLLRKDGPDGPLNSHAPIAQSVRHRIADERRTFRFGESSTDLIIAKKKKNAAVLQSIQIELEVTKDFMKGIDNRDRRRRKREQIKEAAAKMGMSVEDLEAARAKAKPVASKSDKKAKDDAPKRESPIVILSLWAAESPLVGRGVDRENSLLESPGQLNRMLSHSMRDDTFLRSMRVHLQQDKFYHANVKNLEALRKANTKVLTLLGFPDNKGEVDFSANTAEQDLEMRATLGK